MTKLINFLPNEGCCPNAHYTHQPFHQRFFGCRWVEKDNLKVDETCTVMDWYVCPFFRRGVHSDSEWIKTTKEDTQLPDAVGKEYQMSMKMGEQDYGTTEETNRKRVGTVSEGLELKRPCW